MEISHEETCVHHTIIDLGDHGAVLINVWIKNSKDITIKITHDEEWGQGGG